jgi:hypothetical protein
VALMATQAEKAWMPHFSRVLSEINGNSPQTEVDVAVAKTDSAAAEQARRQRRHALILPREHGAWGLLLVPMVTGSGVAFRESNHVVPCLLLLVAALALFWLRTPAESLLGTSAMRVQTTNERREVAVVIVVLAKVAVAATAALLWAGRNPYLWLIGVVAVAAFVGQALLKKLGRHMRMLSEIVGTIGLTSSAPAAYYVITGRFGATGWMLWLANFIFAGNQIHYVQLRIHTARVEGLHAKLSRGWTFAIGQALMTALLTVACVSHLIPPVAFLAFAPILFRGWFYFIQEPAPLLVRRLGWSELGQAVTFCVLFVATISLQSSAQ